MKFAGFQKTSLVDYPNRVASVLFTPGCNLRCPYCHNWRIVVDPKPPFLNEETALGMLEARKKYVDAVVVTGGEPTMHKELPKFLKKLKERGFAVKLDTNGFFPDVLEECMAYVDYVALDVKTSLEKYPRLGAKDMTGFLRAVEMLKAGKVEYEFRTTVVPSFVDAEDVNRMGEIVKGAKTYALQQFVSGDTLDEGFRRARPCSVDAVRRFAEALADCVCDIAIRI